MFERFTERARRVVVMAQDATRSFGHETIGTEHILAGLTAEDEGLASRVLDSLGITEKSVREQIQKRRGLGEGSGPGHLPFTPNAKKVLELALREALSLGHNYIGTEHILLGLIRETNSDGYRLLLQHGVNADAVRSAIIKWLSGPPREKLVQEVADEVTSRLDDRPPPFSVAIKSLMTGEEPEFYAMLAETIAAAFSPQPEETKQVQPFPPAARHYRGLTAPDLQEIGEAALYSASILGVSPEWKRLYADLADAASALLSKAHES